MKIVFNSSLPRSGSTLLQNILAQNPAFHCTPTSGLLELLYGARSNFTNCPEFKAQDRKDMEAAFGMFCHGGMNAFYGIAPKGTSVVVDKSRGWMAYYEWLASFYPDPKIIICIRDLRAIFASMEKLWRKNRNIQNPAENPGDMKMLTVDQRLAHWSGTPPIGLGISRLADVIQKKIDDKFLFVRFEDLTSDPTAQLTRIYEFIGEQYFEHDLFHVEQKTHEDDQIYGIPDLHVIRQEVKPVAPDWNDVLGKQFSDSIVRAFPWFYERFYPEIIK